MSHLFPKLQVSNYTMRRVIKGIASDGAVGEDPPHGLAFFKVDPTDGNYIVSGDLFDPGALRRLQAGTGRILANFENPVGHEQAMWLDIAVSSGGDVYCVDATTSKIFKWTGGTGTPSLVAEITQWSAGRGGGTALVLNASEDKLYVGEEAALADGGLYEITLGPNTIREVFAGNADNPGETLVGRFAMKDDSYIYAARNYLGDIVRIDASTGAMVSLNPSQMTFAVGMMFDPSNTDDLWYVDLWPLFASIENEAEVTDPPVIAKINLPTKVISTVSPHPVICQPIGGAFDTSGNFVVPDVIFGALYMLQRPSLRWRRMRYSDLVLPGSATLIEMSSGYKFLGVFDNGIKFFDPLTHQQIAWFPLDFGTIHYEDGEIFISNWMYYSVIIVLTADEFDLAYYAPFVESFQDWTTKLVTNVKKLSATEIVYIWYDATLDAYTIRKLTRSDETQTPIILVDTGLVEPVSLAVVGNTVYVTDRGDGTNNASTGGKIKKFDAGGALPASLTDVATGLVKPEGLAVDLDGTGLVVEADTGVNGGRLKRVNLTTGATIELLVDNMDLGVSPIPPNLGVPVPRHFQVSDVSVATDGTITFSMDNANEVLTLTPTP